MKLQRSHVFIKETSSRAFATRATKKKSNYKRKYVGKIQNIR
jgi:hypothetical protein